MEGQTAYGFSGNAFTCDGRGRRINKNNITYTYDSQGRVIKQSNGLEFYYDYEGVAACKYNNQLYLYITDGQGNVIAIIDTSGNEEVQYRYDAWGNHVVLGADGNQITSSTHIGNLNPFRYRGYYYDTETGFYFLKSRYYDPVVGRFLNRDSVSYADPETINGLNLYAYCGNNPVMGYDPEGTWNWDAFWLISTIVVTAVVGVVLTVVSSGVAGAVFAGAAIGFSTAAT